MYFTHFSGYGSIFYHFSGVGDILNILVVPWLF